jgi:hypothetical protein
MRGRTVRRKHLAKAARATTEFVLVRTVWYNPGEQFFYAE